MSSVVISQRLKSLASENMVSLNVITMAHVLDCSPSYLGSPLRIAPDLLVTDNADLIRHMNAPSSKWRRSAWYEAMRLDPRHDNVFSTRDEGLHAELRAKEASGVSTQLTYGTQEDGR